MNTTFDELDKVIQRWLRATVDPMIKPTLNRRAKGPNYWYRLQFVNAADPDVSRGWYDQKFEDCIRWVEEKLKNWPDCQRRGFDFWDFKHRRDAEKFITLFHLSWVQ